MRTVFSAKNIVYVDDPPTKRNIEDEYSINNYNSEITGTVVWTETTSDASGIMINGIVGTLSKKLISIA